jgi:flagellar biosynthetic protein FliR
LNIVDLTLNEYLIFAMVLIRMSGLVVFAPFFGGENLPQRARIGLAVFLSFVVFKDAAAGLSGPLELSWITLGMLAGKELLIGLAVGFASGLVFSGAQLAGELIGQQVGFTLANVVDPVTESEVGIISFFNFTMTIAVFLSLNLHLLLIKILALSYRYVGIGEVVLRKEMFGHLSYMFGEIWDYALQIGGPILLLMLLVSVIVGFLTRTMPQLNIIVIGLPSRTMIGLLALFMAVRPILEVAGILCAQMIEDVSYLVELLGPEV